MTKMHTLKRMYFRMRSEVDWYYHMEMNGKRKVQIGNKAILGIRATKDTHSIRITHFIHFTRHTKDTHIIHLTEDIHFILGFRDMAIHGLKGIMVVLDTVIHNINHTRKHPKLGM